MVTIVASALLVVVSLAVIFGPLMIRKRHTPQRWDAAESPHLKDVTEQLFRARVSSCTDYDWVEMLSVHGDFIKVKRPGIAGRISTIVIYQVHPDDRPRVSATIDSHPSSRDEYVFEP